MTMLAGSLSLAAQAVNDADLLAFVPAASAQRYERVMWSSPGSPGVVQQKHPRRLHREPTLSM
jgi:hypothetical protein